MPRITQAEARRYRKRANELEALLQSMYRGWSKEWPNGICIGNAVMSEITLAKVRTARTLRHAVVVTADDDRLYFHALPQPQGDPT